MDMKELEQALKAISEGYEYEILTHKNHNGTDTHYVSVINPNFQEDDGSNYYLLFMVKM